MSLESQHSNREITSSVESDVNIPDHQELREVVTGTPRSRLVELFKKHRAISMITLLGIGAGAGVAGIEGGQALGEVMQSKNHPGATAEPFPSATQDPLKTTETGPTSTTGPSPSDINSIPSVPNGEEISPNHETYNPENGYPLPSAEQIKIPATLTPEQVGHAIEDRFTAWSMAGASVENRKKWLLATDDTAVLSEMAAQNAKVFADNLFVTGWEKNQELAQSATIQQQTNLGLVRAWDKTAQHARGAKEAYHQWVETNDVKVINSSETGGTIEITYVIKDNVANNHVDNVEIGIERNINQTYTAHVTYVKEGDSFKIASFGG